MFVYHVFMTSPLWLLVLSLYKEDYLHFLHLCPFVYTAVSVSGKVERSLIVLTHQWGGCWYSNLPQSVNNCCVIEGLVAFIVFSRCFLDLSVGVRAFEMGLSQISSFFSPYTKKSEDYQKTNPRESNMIIFIIIIISSNALFTNCYSP